jgi:hypothetical protein
VFFFAPSWPSRFTPANSPEQQVGGGEWLAGVNREAREAAKKTFLASDASVVHRGAGPRFDGA